MTVMEIEQGGSEGCFVQWPGFLCCCWGSAEHRRGQWQFVYYLCVLIAWLQRQNTDQLPLFDLTQMHWGDGKMPQHYSMGFIKTNSFRYTL